MAIGSVRVVGIDHPAVRSIPASTAAPARRARRTGSANLPSGRAFCPGDRLGKHLNGLLLLLIAPPLRLRPMKEGSGGRYTDQQRRDETDGQSRGKRVPATPSAKAWAQRLIGRDRIGSPRWKRCNSSTSSSADVKRREISFCKHFKQMVSKSSGMRRVAPPERNGFLLHDLLENLHRRGRLKRRMAG